MYLLRLLCLVLCLLDEGSVDAVLPRGGNGPAESREVGTGDRRLQLLLRLRRLRCAGGRA